MAAKQFLGTRYQSFKDDGTVNAGGSVYFYETGTSTAKTTYSDSALSSANANPVVLNSAGAADIWYTGDADVTVKDSAGTTIDTYTSINPPTSSATVESNLIANGSFEDGGSTTPSNWTRSAPPTGGTSAQDTDSAHGLYSWKFTSGGSGAGSLITTDFFNVAEDRTFTVIWQMKSSVADVRNLVEVVWYDDADAELSASSLYDDSATNPTSWTTKSYLATPVASAVRAKLRLTGCHSSDATTGSTWFDGIVVTESPAPITGTWTPSVGGNATYTSRTGTYTKVGNMVNIYGSIQINAIGTGSPYLISGLPFTAANGDAGIVVSSFSSLVTAAFSIWGIVKTGTTTLEIRGITGAASTGTTAIDLIGNSTIVVFRGTYQI